MLETLDFTIHIGSTYTNLFIFRFVSEHYAAYYVYFTIVNMALVVNIALVSRLNIIITALSHRFS